MHTINHSFEQMSKLQILYNLVYIGVKFINLVTNFNLISSAWTLENLFCILFLPICFL